MKLLMMDRAENSKATELLVRIIRDAIYLRPSKCKTFSTVFITLANTSSR